MTDKVQKIREEVERRMNCFKNERNTLLKASDNNLSLGARIAMCEEILSFIDSLQEEPVSEELEEAANTYVDNWYKLNNLDKESYPIDVEISKNDFKVGAKWQKEQLIKEAIDGIARPDDDEVWCDLKSFSLKDNDKVKIIIIEEN